MKVFVTGSTGFIGRSLIPALVREGVKVVALVRHPQPDLEALGVTCVLGDLTRPETFAHELHDCNTVIHLAASRSNHQTLDQLNKTNADVLKHLFSKYSKLKHIIFTSSVYVYGLLENMPATENHPLHAYDAYGQSKILAESLLKDLCLRHQIAYTIVRPALVYGPGDIDIGFIPKLFKLSHLPLLPLINSGKNHQHLIYISDLVKALMQILSYGGHNRTYNIASAKSIPLSELINIISSRFNYKPRIVNLPLPRSLLMRLPVIGSSLSILFGDWRFDISAAKKDWGFKPQIDYKKGLNTFIDTLIVP